MNTYFNGVRPVVRKWIAVIQRIFCSDTSSVFDLQVWCWWIRFTVAFISSTQRTCRCLYLHSSLFLYAPHCQYTESPHITPFISFDLPDETDFSLVFSFRSCVFMWSLGTDWDQQSFSQNPLNKNKLLNQCPLQTNTDHVCTDALEVGGSIFH